MAMVQQLRHGKAEAAAESHDGDDRENNELANRSPHSALKQLFARDVNYQSDGKTD